MGPGQRLRGTATLLAAVAVFLPPLLWVAAVAEAGWSGPDGRPLPFESPDEIREFLHTAEIVSTQKISEGINQPLKVRLEKDGVVAHAVFRTVDESRQRIRLSGKTIRNFRDSYVFECAAYELSLMLGIDNVPPCVLRRIGASHGSLQLWIEDAMTEKKRRALGQDPPGSVLWPRRQQTMRLFDALIFNFDRNQGNILIDRQWNQWLIDHTRSFLLSTEIDRIERIVWCERGIWDRLRALDAKSSKLHLGPYLDAMRIRAMLERRDKLVAHLQQRIDKIGEGAVIYDAAVSSALPDLGVALDSDDLPERSTPLDELDPP